MPEKAYALFHQRKQKPDEAIHPYHAELGVLFRKSFPAAWNQQENQLILIPHFLENVYDCDLSYDVNIMQERPNMYAEAFQLLERCSGKWDFYWMSRQRVRAGRPGMGQSDATPGGQGAQGGGKPMDVEAACVTKGRALVSKTQTKPSRAGVEGVV